MLNVKTTRRPADLWLNDLTKAKAESLKKDGGPKTSIQEIMERVNDPSAPESALIPTSPRSVEACLRLGVDPIELQFHPVSFFKRPMEDPDVTKLRFEKNEAVRQVRIQELVAGRKALIDENWQPAEASGGHGGSKSSVDSTMIEKERERMEVSKRRQERELEQMREHERKRAELVGKQQRKIDELEARTQELVKAKKESDAAWIAKQRDIELLKAREEQAIEIEAKRLAEIRYAKDKELQARLEEDEKRRKREAGEKELERRKKTEGSRAATDTILEQQAAVIAENRAKMQGKDAERAKRMKEELKQRAIENEEKRKQAESRIAAALSQNEEIVAKRRTEFEAREAEAERRRVYQEEQRKKDEKAKGEEEARKEKERKQKYDASVAAEEARKASISSKAKSKDAALADLYKQRKKEHDLKKVETDFELKLRLDKVDALAKNGLYKRQQGLEKIMTAADNTRSILREREALKATRKEANMKAALERQKMQASMDQMKMSQTC
ncbi:hypothetical protein FOA52_007405 [Chlamydomonas sp. UWO 241]|nr:hypothetical protein FOA52_007405 [Chlamydomonas sp. UWO 241]